MDFWRELLRLHFANRSLPPLFAQHAAGIIHGKGLFTDHPVATWVEINKLQTAPKQRCFRCASDTRMYWVIALN